MKAAGIAGTLAAASIAASPTLLATQRDTMVGENQAVVTPLGANATAVSYWSNAPDGWHVVTTVDTIAGVTARPSGMPSCASRRHWRQVSRN